MTAPLPGGSSDSLFLDYIQGLSQDDRHDLVSRPASAFFIFRMLPDVAQQVVLKLIWNSNVTNGIADGRSHESVVVKQQLYLLYRIGLARRSEDGPAIDKDFRRAYLRAVMLGAHRCAGLRPVSELDDKKKNKEIGKKSTERWECILKYLALATEQNMNSVSVTTRRLFTSAGYTTEGIGGSVPEITSAGFQFLLLSPVQQLWSYMIEYLKLEAADKHDVRPAVQLLIQIVLCVESRNEAECERRAFYMEDNWTERQNELVMHMRELGLVFIRKRKDGYFFLTPMLANLSVPSDDTESVMERKSGNVIVETNFRVYAYTSSSLQLAILSTFTEMTYRFNDMSVGVLTRDSVRKALMVGITASQIISFLRTNAHPQTLASGGPLHCLPITVADQIRLWEDERKRLKFTDATLYSNFESEREFVGVKQFSKQEGVILYTDDRDKLVIVTEEGHEKVKAWWKQNRHNI